MNLTKKKLFAGLMVIFMLAIVLVPAVVSAQAPNCTTGTTELTCKAISGCMWGPDPTDPTANICQVSSIRFPDSNVAPSNMDLYDVIETVIDAVLGFLGFIAVIIVLIGGFQWMTAGGDDGKVGTAKKTLSAGVIGLIIVLAAWGIAKFVINILVG